LTRALTFQAALLFLVSIVPVLLGFGWLNFQYTSTALQQQVGLSTTAAATSVEQTLSAVLLRELERLTTLAHQPALIAAASQASAAPRPAESLAYTNAKPGDEIRQNFVNNLAGQILRPFRDQYPNRVVALFADKYGNLLSTTTPSWPAGDLSKQGWWLDPARWGTETTTISRPTEVEGLGTLIFITIPVTDETDAVHGIVAVGLNFTQTAEALLNSTNGKTSTMMIVDSNGQILYAVPRWTTPAVPAVWDDILKKAFVPSYDLQPDYLLGYAPMQLRQGYAFDAGRDLRTVNRLNWTLVQATPRDIALATLDNQLRLLAAGSAATAVVVMLMALLVVRGLVIRPLARIEGVIGDVRRQGMDSELLAAVPQRLPRERNEIGRVAGAFGEMLSELGRLTTQREAFYAQQQRTGTDLRAAAARLSSAAAEQEAVTVSTNAVLMQVLAAFQALDEATTAIVAHAAEVAAQANSLRTQHQAGEQAVVTTHQALSDLQQATQVLEQGAQTLATDASAAGTLVEEANAVAATTHLLSLNAMIESVDAGQYGARFGVIADEVRNLAAAAARAAGSIEMTVERIATQTQLAADETRQANTAANHGAQQIEILSAMMQDLLLSANGLADNAERIRQRSEAQRSHSSDVQQGSHQLADAMQQVTDVSRHVASQAQELLRLANILEQAG
jgi:methyl-accepting chemotaxis protein